MDNIFESIKAYLYDRSVSPLFGAFITAWSVYNYRIFIAIFAGEERPVEKVFEQIDELFYPFDFSICGYSIAINGELFHGIVIPSFITLLYIYIYPLLAKPVYEHSLRKQKELREIKQQEEKNRLLSVEESREIFRRMYDQEEEYSKNFENYKEQIDNLKKIIKDLEQEQMSKQTIKTENRGMNFGDFKEVELAEFDSMIEKGIASIRDGNFQLSDLFRKELWESLDSTQKQKIGKYLKNKVERGDFVGVNIGQKGTSNQQLYIKNTAQLPPIEERVLVLFAGLKPEHGLIEDDIRNKIDGHIEEIRLYLDNLVKKGYVNNFGKTDENEKLYNLSQKGRKYLVENNLLPDK